MFNQCVVVCDFTYCLGFRSKLIYTSEQYILFDYEAHLEISYNLL